MMVNMKKNIYILIIVLLLFGSQACFTKEVSQTPTIEVQFKETGNIQYSVFSTTINSVNGVIFKDALAAYLLSQRYNITYANEYQMVVLKNNSFIASTLIGDIKFLFNYSQYGNVIQFVGKGDAGYRMLLFNLMLGVLNQYTGCPVHGKTYN